MLNEMMAEMFLPQIQEQFLDGMKRMAKGHNVEIDGVQIRLSFSGNDKKPIKYEKCLDWAIVEETTFKTIMDIKVDILGREAMLTGPILEAMMKNGIKHEIPMENFAVFMYSNGKDIGVAIYDKTQLKKTCSVRDLFVEPEPVQEE